MTGSGPEPETTDDAFLGGALRVLQPARGYRAGLDAVLLAAAVPARDGERVLDAGAGVGVVGLCIAARVRGAEVCLVENQPALVDLARANIDRNDLRARMCVAEADVAAGGRALARPPLQAGGCRMLAPGGADHVAANPPYHAIGTGTPAPDLLKREAHAMPDDSLDAWLRFLATATTGGGTATIVHLAAALPELLAVTTPRFGGIKVLPIHPRAGEAASRVIVQGIKGSRAPLVLLPGLVLHGDGTGFRPQVEAILRTGAPLVL